MKTNEELNAVIATGAVVKFSEYTYNTLIITAANANKSMNNVSIVANSRRIGFVANIATSTIINVNVQFHNTQLEVFKVLKTDICFVIISMAPKTPAAMATKW